MSGKTVLITGCSSGIGEAAALRLAKAKWKVFASARHAEVLGKLKQAGCETLALDVRDEASMAAAVAEIERREGAIGVLVSNAGYAQAGALEEIAPDALRGQFETNVFGLLRLTQLVLPGMRKAGRGRIVNIGSMGGKLTLPGYGAYHATKYAVEALSDELRFELKGFGIDVVLIEPGMIRTAFGEVAASKVEAVKTDSPYAFYNREVVRLSQEAYVKGPFAMLSGGPDAVAKVIARALRAQRPRARYTVTPSATVLLTLRRWLSDAMWDSFLRMNFPAPGNKSA